MGLGQGLLVIMIRAVLYLYWNFVFNFIHVFQGTEITICFELPTMMSAGRIMTPY